MKMKSRRASSKLWNCFRRNIRHHRSALLLTVPCLIGIAPASAQNFANGPVLSVNVQADRHPISPDIYGINNFGTDATFQAFMKELKLPVSRSGGDGTTRYNWSVDASNAGNDWYYMAGGGASTYTPGGSMDALVKANKASGAKTILTIPVIDYINNVPANRWDCSFPTLLFGDQTDHNPYVHPFINGVQTDAGNGFRKSDGKQIILTESQILRTHIKNTPAHQADWVKHLVAAHGTAKNGGVAIYQMDNEPSGWGNTHRDIHPDATGYDELVNKTIAMAHAVKSVDPTAAVLGPSDFGWAVYEMGGKPGDDANSHGMGFADYYLSQMRNYELQHHVRLLDFFDEHYYPTPDDGGQPIALAPAGNAVTQARRLQATRSLWDPSYIENNWIGKYFGAIRLLPRFHQWVDARYPNTKISITEYNFGGLESINGALAQADVLGIFARERVDLATIWGPPNPTDPGAFAFRIYRNYDGKGSQFGDTYVRSTSKDQGKLAIYGAERTSDGALTLMIINKTANTLLSTVFLSGWQQGTLAQVYRYTPTNLKAIIRGTDWKISPNGFSGNYPPNSITLVVIPKK